MSAPNLTTSTVTIPGLVMADANDPSKWSEMAVVPCGDCEPFPLFREAMTAVPAEAWSRAATLDGEATDLYGLALSIVQRDADHLKALAYRLHQADLRPPKPGDDLPRRPEA